VCDAEKYVRMVLWKKKLIRKDVGIGNRDLNSDNSLTLAWWDPEQPQKP
jgi:hypothetical protein